MELVVARHGHAVPGDFATPDQARWLTAPGRTAAASLGAFLRDRGTIPDVVLSSPLVRAVQTAELIARELGYSGAIEALPCLAPGGPLQQIVDEAAARGGRPLVVSHEPTVSALVSWQTGTRVSGMRPAQAALVADGSLVWMSA